MTRRALAAVAVLALAGCSIVGGNGSDESAANRATTNRGGSAPAPNPLANSPLIGRWADSPAECVRPVEIFDNGTVRASDGSRGYWRIEGNRLTFNLGTRTFVFTVVATARDRITLIDQNGQRAESVRCT